MKYKFKTKDKVYKWFPKTDKYETQHKHTLDPKVYTVAVANSDGVILHNVPYILFGYDGNILSTDYRKVVNMRTNNRICGTNAVQTWIDAVIVPASVYNKQTDTFWIEKDSTDIMQEYENKVYNF